MQVANCSQNENKAHVRKEQFCANVSMYKKERYHYGWFLGPCQFSSYWTILVLRGRKTKLGRQNSVKQFL